MSGTRAGEPLNQWERACVSPMAEGHRSRPRCGHGCTVLCRPQLRDEMIAEFQLEDHERARAEVIITAKKCKSNDTTRQIV